MVETAKRPNGGNSANRANLELRTRRLPEPPTPEMRRKVKAALDAGASSIRGIRRFVRGLSREDAVATVLALIKDY